MMSCRSEQPAFRLGVSFRRLNETIRGKRSVTPDTALRLAQVTGMSADVWLGLQQDWDSPNWRSCCRSARRLVDHFLFRDQALMPLSRTPGVASRRFASMISREVGWALMIIGTVGAVAGACRSQEQQRSNAATALDTTGIRASIDSLAAKVARANESGDADLYATTWAVDGIMSYDGSSPVHGRDSIVAAFRRRPSLPPGARMTIHPTELRIQSAEWAYVMGVDTLRFTPPNASAPVQETSTFLVVLRKGSEGWQTYREVLSANQ